MVTRRHRIGATALISVGLLSIVLAAPVSAAKPARGCTSTTDLMSIEQFRALSLSIGVPADLLGADWDASLRTAVDKNRDGNICVKDLPDTKGHLGTWIFNVVDNTSN